MNLETKQSRETGSLRLIRELDHQPRAFLFPPGANLILPLALCSQRFVQSQVWRCRVLECHAGSPPQGSNRPPACPALSLPLTLHLLSVHFNSREGWASGAKPKVGKHLCGESLNVRQAPGQQDEFLAASQAKKWRQFHTTFYQMKIWFFS